MTAPGDRIELVLETPWRGRLGYVWHPAVCVGAIAWMLVTRSVPSFVAGGILLAVSAFSMWRIAAALVHLRGEPMRIEATRHGISSQFWRLAWGDVERLEIRTVAGARTLMIVPRAPHLVERRTLAWRASGRVGRLQRGDGRMRILEKWIDRPLETLAAQLEELAGRPLAASAEA